MRHIISTSAIILTLTFAASVSGAPKKYSWYASPSKSIQRYQKPGTPKYHKQAIPKYHKPR